MRRLHFVNSPNDRDCARGKALKDSIGNELCKGNAGWVIMEHTLGGTGGIKTLSFELSFKLLEITLHLDLVGDPVENRRCHWKGRRLTCKSGSGRDVRVQAASCKMAGSGKVSMDTSALADP